MTAAGRFGAGLLVGLFGAIAIGLFTGSDETADTTTTTVTSTTVEATAEPWFDAGEVMIGATAILPQEFNVEDGLAFFDYDLVGLGPTLDAGEREERPDLAMPTGDHLTMPERWVLTTGSGRVVEASTGPLDSSVRFELPAGDDEVASITLVGWRVAVPFGDRVELPVEEGASEVMRRGTAIVETVLEQSISTIVQVDFDDNGDAWDRHVTLRPLDSRWRVSGRQGGGLQLIWEGDDAPESVVLEDAGFAMRPVTGELTIPVPGRADG